MSTTADFMHSLGSLFDLSEQKRREKHRRTRVGFEYDFNSDDVNSAWSEVAVLVSNSFVDLTDSEADSDKLNLYKISLEKNRKSLEIDELVISSVDNIRSLIDSQDTSTRPFDGSKLKAKFHRRCLNNDPR